MRATDDRSLGPALTLAGLAAGAYMLPGLAAAVPLLRRPMGIEDRTASGTAVALTFDDGPHPRGTPAVLQILEERGVRATFFLVGEQVARSPALAAEIVAAGHDVGLHCHRHRNLLRLAPRQVSDDLARASDLIERATGRGVRLYRPPYGVFNLAALSWARSRDMRPLLWTHWGRDWEKRATAESIAQRVTGGIGPGSVLLLHDADDYSAPGSWQRTVAALPRVLEEIERRELTLGSA